MFDKDIFVNIIGGLQIKEPASDLAVAVAIASSVRDRPVYADIAVVGEVGLSGELRAVSQLEVRLKEAQKLGFKRCIVPRTSRRQEFQVPKGLWLDRCRIWPKASQKRCYLRPEISSPPPSIPRPEYRVSAAISHTETSRLPQETLRRASALSDLAVAAAWRLPMSSRSVQAK